MMENESFIMWSSSISRLLCKVCGDVARGYNFDVITCLSCKAFFRRNALQVSKMRECQRKSCCRITKETRIYCRACRLKKCFECGMNPSLIQSVYHHKTNWDNVKQNFTSTKRNLTELSWSRPLSLLRNDRSLLTNEQWNLLSNIIRSYDEHNCIGEVRRILEEKSSLPVKLRFKPADTLNLMSKPLENIALLVELSPHFRNLSSQARRTVALHNSFCAGGINGYYVARETNQLSNAHYMIASGTLYGFEYMMKCVKDNERLEPNGNLIKIMLFVLIFASNCSMVVFNDQEDASIMTSTIELVRTQDIYLTVLWKYLIYLYGYNQAIKRFSLMVKSVLDMLNRVEELSENTTLQIMIERTVTHTEHSLVIKD